MKEYKDKTIGEQNEELWTKNEESSNTDMVSCRAVVGTPKNVVRELIRFMLN